VYDIGGQNLTNFAEKVRAASEEPPWCLDSSAEVRDMPDFTKIECSKTAHSQ
jgi:hypothetical protein